MSARFDDLLPFHVEHIIPRKHGGGDKLANLALACWHCNCHKGPNLSGIDPFSKKTVRLLHPRRDRWDDPFLWDGVMLIGRTSKGRATVQVLAMNAPDRIELRRLLRQRGDFLD